MNLEKNEFMLVVDSTNGLALLDLKSISCKDQITLNVLDSMGSERLDEKWGVDGAALAAKLDAATEDEFKTLWKNIGEFWERNDRENHA